MFIGDKMAERVRFPDGREVNIHEVISYIYGLGASEVQVFHLLMENGKMTADEIAERLGVSKASVNKALNTLSNKGLIEKEKVEEKRRGRPTYLYTIRKDYVGKKIEEDAISLIYNVRETIKKLLSERT